MSTEQTTEKNTWEKIKEAALPAIIFTLIGSLASGLASYSAINYQSGVRDERIEQRFKTHETKLGEHDTKFKEHDDKFKSFDSLEKMVVRIETKLDILMEERKK
jgi:hypothetical protein